MDNSFDGKPRASRKVSALKRSDRPSKRAVASPISVNTRLDQGMPLETAEWTRVEQKLVRLLEFVPVEMVFELVQQVAAYGDDQARRGYILAQEDLLQTTNIEEIA